MKKIYKFDHIIVVEIPRGVEPSSQLHEVSVWLCRVKYQDRNTENVGLKERIVEEIWKVMAERSSKDIETMLAIWGHFPSKDKWS